MKFRKKLATLICGAAMLVGAESASAAVFVATYTGTVSSGFDDYGLFGGSVDLTGESYVATYTYDTAIGVRVTDLPDTDTLSGGIEFGVPSPISATITINGHTAAVDGSYEGYVNAGLGEPNQERTFSIGSNGISFTDSALENVDYLNLPTLETTLPLTSVHTYGDFSDSVYDFVTYHYTTFAYATLTGGTVQISGVLEPAAWMLMLGGFGLVGAALRSGRRWLAVT